MQLNRFFPFLYLHYSGQRDYLRYLREAECNQWRSRAELELIQTRKLTRLVRHAAEHVPYYRQLFQQHGINSNVIRSASDLNIIPLLSKDNLRSQAASLVADGYSPKSLHIKRTSGSTGEPTRIYIDHDRAMHSWAYNTRHNRWAGVDWGTRIMTLWYNAPRTPYRKRDSWLRNRASSFASKAQGRNTELWLSPFDLTEEACANLAAQAAEFKPEVLLGYPVAIHFFAEYLKANSQRLGPFKGVVVGGEMLYPAVRDLIEQVFECQVFERYGATEVDIIASECRHRRLHLNDDNLVVEFVPDGQSELQRIVITDLNNYAAPVLRYDIGDVGLASDDKTCPCGRGLSLMQELNGRRGENLKTADGRTVNGIWFHFLLDKFPELEKYRVIQRTLTKLEIDAIWANGRIPAEIISHIVNEVQGKFGANCAVLVNQVESIQCGKNGKYTFVSSEV